MAKENKKNIGSENPEIQEGQEIGEIEVKDIPIEETKSEQEDPGYTKGKWGGFDQFQCNYCAFDSLHENVIKEHIQDKHRAIPEIKKIESPILDRYGNKLEKLIE